MLHQVGVSFDLYYDARKHKIKILVLQGIIYTVGYSYVWVFECVRNVGGFFAYVSERGPSVFVCWEGSVIGSS